MISQTLIHDSQLRVAHHYVEMVCKANADYVSGFERSLKAVQVFDKERLQIDNVVNWLLRHADTDEAGLLLVKLLSEGYPLLYALLESAELQRWLECSIEVARRFGDIGAQAAHCLALGYVIRRTISLEQSQPLFEQANTFAQEHGDPRLQLRCLVALARCAKDQRAFDKAGNYNQQAYAIALKLGDAMGMYEYFDLVAYQFYVENRFTDALDAYQQAYTWALKTGGYRQISITLTLIGNILHLQGQYQEAITYLRQALDFSMPTRYPPVIIYTLHVLGNALISAQDRGGAQETYLKALRLAEQYHLTESAATMCAELGILAYRDNDLPLALDYLESAIEQLKSLNADIYLCFYTCYLVAVHAARRDESSTVLTLREGVELSGRILGDPRTVLVVWCAVLVWMNRATHDNIDQFELTETAALWTGFVSASSHITPEDHVALESLLPQMALVLGDEHLAARLESGKQLDLGAVIAQIRIALALP